MFRLLQVFCFALSIATTNTFLFFSSSRGKNSIDPFLCKEEEFIHHTERRRQRRKQRIEDKELKKRRAELFRSRSVSRSLSSSLSKSAKRERERERERCFFFKRNVKVFLSRDKNSSGFLSSLSSSWRLLQRRRRLCRRHFSRSKAREGEEALLFLGQASKLALLRRRRRRRRRRNNKSGKRGLGWLFGRRLKKVLFCAKEEKTHRQRY